MSYFSTKMLNVNMVIAGCLLLITSCSTVSQEKAPANQKNFNKSNAAVQINTFIQKMDAAKKPESHYGDIRTYALNNFNYLSDKEVKLIQSSDPKVFKNNNTLEYCFVWTLPNKDGCLEVVATPPPEYMPIATFRRDRVYYP